MQEGSWGEKWRTKAESEGISPEGALLDFPRLATRGADTAAVKNASQVQKDKRALLC
jgi:hypothetical protein